MLPNAVLEVRQRVLDVVKEAAELACRCDPDQPCLACRARATLEFLTTAGFRMRRWRNPEAPPITVVHVAGPVISCREYRRSCPGFIVDRRQTCDACGEELVRGRWAIFHQPGELVAVMLARTGFRGADLPIGPPDGRPGQIPCPGRAQLAQVDAIA